MVDLTMLASINDLAIRLRKSTLKTKENMKTLLDYLSANPNVIMLHRKSDMILKVHSDGSYLLVRNSRNRTAANVCFSDNKYATEEDECQNLRYQECNETKLVMASVVECETVISFLNFQMLLVLRITTKELGHP